MIRLPYGRISSPFGRRVRFGKVENHSGIDVAYDNETGHVSVRAPFSGLFWPASQPHGGLVGVLQGRDGFTVILGHMSRAIEGPTEVEVGQWIGDSGDSGFNSSGPHLHVTLMVGGKNIDPMPYVEWVRPEPARGRLISYVGERNGVGCNASFSWPLPATGPAFRTAMRDGITVKKSGDVSRYFGPEEARAAEEYIRGVKQQGGSVEVFVGRA